MSECIVTVCSIMPELKAFRSVEFDWTRQLRSVWHDPPYHLSSLHQGQLDDLVEYFERTTRDPNPLNEPLGRVIVAPAGYGKTHLVGELRRRVWEMNGWFILLDFIGIRDFWSSVALHFLNSLQVRMADGKTQYDRLILEVASQLEIHREMLAIAKRCRGRPDDLIRELVQLFVQSLADRYGKIEATRHHGVVTALVLLISEDLDCHNIAHAWLQGMKLDPGVAQRLGLLQDNSPINVVEGLCWIMSLVGPTLIAVDQIDSIVSARNALARTTGIEPTDEQKEAQFIIDSLAQGLMDLHEKKRRAVTVVSCLEASWEVLKGTTTAVTARFVPPAILRALPGREAARDLIAARLHQAYTACSFEPPYPTWPFTDAAFDSAVGFSPRELLIACETHRQHCVAAGHVIECNSFTGAEPKPKPDSTVIDDVDRVYEAEMEAAAVPDGMDAAAKEQLRDLFDGTLRLFQKHLELPNDIDVMVQRDPDQKRPSLHGRLSFIFRSEGDREQHYCFRIIGHNNAIAFQSRLKAAMTASGIDTALKFRHLFILRRGEPPGGPKSMALIEQFLNAGGRFIAPTNDDLRVFIALQKMAQRDIAGFDAWLRTRRPLFETTLFQTAGLCPPPFLSASPGTSGGDETRVPDDMSDGEAVGSRANRKHETKATDAITDDGTNVDSGVEPASEDLRVIPIGHRFECGTPGDRVTLAADLLPRHIAVFAGSGSGKTVLLRRIVEEAALLGIPSIVLDINNDLARLGDCWPTLPEGFNGDDAKKAAAYSERADVVIWTPGVSSGNPISLNLLPDFAAIGDQRDEQTEDERSQAVEMARATLAAYLGGAGQKASLKQGILANALRAFANRGGGSLDDLIELLTNLPEDVTKISDALKLANEIADQLLAVVAINPLLKSTGASLDPQQLFYGSNGKTRVSVINLGGLASDEARQSFVNQLQMALFTWIKQNPTPSGRLYVLDEAQNFAPSQRGTPCKASTLSLVAQARKYGLGMVFATQQPKGIDNAIASNCTTHVYGRMASPATIQAIRELMASRGGAADDIGRLTRGEFYFSTDGFHRPVKIRTPLCLSYHPANPPTAEEVIQKARSQRA